MNWGRVKRGQGGGGGAEAGPSGASPEIRWLNASENPWGVPVLDVRPVTLEMISASQDPTCAQNAISFANEDGLAFLDDEPPSARTTGVGLRYRTDGPLADGVLFTPTEMEHKWAIFHHRGRIILVRSWMRLVVATAEVRQDGDRVEITSLRGVIVDEEEAAEFRVRALDYLVRSHVLGEVYPAPLPDGMEQEPVSAAYWCMSSFGNLAQFATPHSPGVGPPEAPLRVDSLLHIAAARVDLALAEAQLQRGVAVGLPGRDGRTPLHWALGGDGVAMLRFLIERGAPVDARSDDGTTPLMDAVQGRFAEKAAFLLDHGARPDAADVRGFTALHRAAEMGQLPIVDRLLDRGATPDPEAQGHTPRSLAEARGERAIVDRLTRATEG